MKLLKSKIKFLADEKKTTLIRCDQIIKSSLALSNLCFSSELYRKDFAEQLRLMKSNNDINMNKVFELELNK